MVAANAADIARMIIIASLWRRYGSAPMREGYTISGCKEYLPAGGGQIRHRDRRLRLWWLLGRLGMEHRVLEPVVEIVAAAFGLAGRLLSFAFRAARLAHDAHMEMIVVPPPRTHLVQERAILAGFAAQRLLDRLIDAHALDLRVLGGGLDHGGLHLG